MSNSELDASDQEDRQQAEQKMLLRLTDQVRYWRRISIFSVTANAWQGAINIILLVVAVVAVVVRPAPQILIQDQDGRLIEANPVDQPIYGQELSVVPHAERAIRCVHIYTYLNHDGVVDSCCRRFFTPDGCNQFKVANRANASMVDRRSTSSNISVVREPVLTARGTDKQGRFFWRYQMVIQVRMGNGQDEIRQQEVVTVDVAVRQQYFNAQGLGVSKYTSVVTGVVKTS